MKQKVVRQSLKDQVMAILIERMIDGSLAPGDRIKELQVANELGTSQAPVREAIRCLETLGYVVHIPHVGAMVKSFNRKEVEEAYQVREALEKHAVSRGATEIERLVADLSRCLEQMDEATEQGDISLFIQADNAFHRSIVQCSLNGTMVAMWDSLKMQLLVIATLVEASMPLKTIYALHPPIVEALKRKHYHQASQLLEGHYKSVSDYWSKTSGGGSSW